MTHSSFLSPFKRFIADERGSVTTDWVVLTSSVMGLGVASVMVVTVGMSDVSGDVSEYLGAQEVTTSFSRAFKNVVFFEDFENGRADGWAGATVSDDDPAFGSFLGRFGGTGGDEMVHKTWSLDPDAGFAVVEFDLHAIDTWDLERVNIFLNSQIASQRSFSSHTYDEGQGMTYDAGLAGVNITYTTLRETAEYGYSARGDANQSSLDESMRVRMIVTDPGDSLKLGFGSTLNQSISDESWAVDNVRVTSTNDPDGA